MPIRYYLIPDLLCSAIFMLISLCSIKKNLESQLIRLITITYLDYILIIDEMIWIAPL